MFARTTLAQVAVSELKEIVDRNHSATVVDVRESVEWATGHIPSARHIAMSELVARHGDLVGQPGPVYVVCHSGSRSVRCAAFLSDQGFDVVNVIGGTGAWAAAGYPLAR